MILKSNEFLKTLNAVKKDAWICFAAVVQKFLGNNKEDNYAELVANLVSSLGNMGYRMSMKFHMLDAHLDEFKKTLGTYSEEHGERFHQDIKNFESRYQGQYKENMIGDYIWGLIRESDLEYRKKIRKTSKGRLLHQTKCKILSEAHQGKFVTGREKSISQGHADQIFEK